MTDDARGAGLAALSAAATQDNLSDGGRYFDGKETGWHADLTQCSPGECGEYQNSADGRFVEALWNAYRAGQLVPASDLAALQARVAELEGALTTIRDDRAKVVRVVDAREVARAALASTDGEGS